jgi:hypothetical protein
MVPGGDGEIDVCGGLLCTCSGAGDKAASCHPTYGGQYAAQRHPLRALGALNARYKSLGVLCFHRPCCTETGLYMKLILRSGLYVQAHLLGANCISIVDIRIRLCIAV